MYCTGYKRMKPASNPTTSGLRKGAWTAQEDMLLKKCVEKFGEGKWHLIPLKAGLNRCRKSCRLRWLNYLKPDIKRGEFGEDEIDLMLRLHKLLGNRWSLIAGRIPGRTANDVKNYWNTHLRARSKQQKEEPKVDRESPQRTMVTVIKPKPRTLSKIFNHNPHIETYNKAKLIGSSSKGVENTNDISPELFSDLRLPEDKINEYMKELLDGEMKEIDDEVECYFGGVSWVEPDDFYVVDQGDEQNNLFDFSKDEIMWDLLDL